MRNINKYPITVEEVVKALLDLADIINGEDRIGDMRPTLLKVAAQTIEQGNRLYYDIDNLPLTKKELAGFKRRFKS